MPRKPKKGYFVRGQFVAEGSELDLELKRELKGGDEPTRTDLKKESSELQKLGEDLLTLRAELMEKLELPARLVEAVAEAKRITNFEGKRRQMQFIGKLMRQLPPEQVEAVRAALVEQHMPSRKETELLHHAEKWRAQLIANDDAVGQWLNIHPATDSQQLRALVRQARKDAKPEKPGEAPRHGRAYREIFQLVRTALGGDNESEEPSE
ncbi:ribosome biogenesis factor YjgA [Curvibacter sp. APW13]|uniref:ribosome biogenesis factor YjgA n=1 Tax=Curvibacter sp. APW13 TaxID=3077236 RepID=UPI0028DE6608|nr:ribosome biogenesis factor YjgA [Curvibacter sp. APW13]MDT8991148.1 ribosome biogenesis factor YjgA [Curvibacter sp. APW13]